MAETRLKKVEKNEKKGKPEQKRESQAWGRRWGRVWGWAAQFSLVTEYPKMQRYTCVGPSVDETRVKKSRVANRRGLFAR